MKNMSLKHIAEACKGTLYAGEAEENREITCAVIDSRLMEKGGLFVAARGERADGHQFIAQVYTKGALCVISEKTPVEVLTEYGIAQDAWGAYILVEDSFQALKDIAEYYRKQLSIPIVGITGSVGKTSTKEFIAGVLSQRYRVLKTEGNFNNEIGLPLTLLKIRPEHEAAVVEMGISEFGEMHRLSKMARPDICVLTNIGQCHLENLKSREGILKAKSEIFDYMAEDGYVCVNGDDDMLASLYMVKGRKVIRFGLTSHGVGGYPNDVYASEIESKGLWGSTAKMNMEGAAYDIAVPLPGQHMVDNAMAAAAAARLLGLNAEDIQTGIGKVEPVGGRSRIITLQEKVVIDDCYNANPVSMRSAIDLLAMSQRKEGVAERKVAILGDMFELGGDSDTMHADIGRYAAEKAIDVILCVGENARFMYQAAAAVNEKGLDIRHYADRAALMKALPGLTEKGDTILVKASHGMDFAAVVAVLCEE